jgi:hypothetical protein
MLSGLQQKFGRLGRGKNSRWAIIKDHFAAQDVRNAASSESEIAPEDPS